jgi:hypothetical protein
MSRPITILAVLQTLSVVIGFFALGTVLKISGYPDELAVRWNPLAVFLREPGVWLLLLPALWVVFATSAQRLNRGFFSYRVALVLGLCTSIGIIALFVYATFAFTRPLLIHVR